MDKIEPKTHDQYIKALTDISRAITSELYLEDLLKLIRWTKPLRGGKKIQIGI